MATILVKVYNRFPYTFEGQCDSRPFKIAPHSETIVTYDMAIMAVKQSTYKWIGDNLLEAEYRCGVVPEGHEFYGVPLQESDIHTGDPLADYEMDLSVPGATYTPIKVDNSLNKPAHPRPIKSDVGIQIGGGNA